MFAFEDGSAVTAATYGFLERSAESIARRQAAPPTDHSRHANIIEADRRRKGSWCGFTLAELRRWSVDRSSGYLKVVRPKRRATARPPAPAAVSGPDHSEIIRQLLDWIDGRAQDPAIVVRAAALVGRAAAVHQ